jgi:hypothetical protein
MNNHLQTSEGMPSAKKMIIMRVPSDKSKKLWTDEPIREVRTKIPQIVYEI